MRPAFIIGMGDAGGGFVDFAPGNGARDGRFGACDEAAGCAGLKRGAGVVLGTDCCCGARLGWPPCTGTFAEGAPSAAASSGPFGSGAGGFTLAPLLPMITLTIHHPTLLTMTTP